MKILVNMRVIPIGTCSPSLGEYVKKAVEVIRKYDIDCIITPFSTAFEIENIEELSNIISEVASRLRADGVGRLAIDISLDLRFDKEISLNYKVRRITET